MITDTKVEISDRLTGSETIASIPIRRSDVYLLVAGSGAIALAIAVLALGRTNMTFGTETDFLGGFLPEAQRILSGQPLEISFHPPLYSAVLAVAYIVVSDWLWSALVISWISVVTVLVSQTYVLAKLWGRYAAFGGLIGLGASSLFLTYGALATSDLAFLGVYSVALAAMIHAIDTRSPGWWIAVGIVAGLGFLMRTNGIVLMIVGVYPLLMAIPVRKRLRLAGTFATGALLPVAVWFLISTSTGSPFWPDQNYLNVAMTYFDEVGDGHSGESRMRMVEEFDSLRDVLLHDPPHILRSYVRDAFRTLWRTFSPQVLLAFPLSILALLGAVPLLLRSRSFFGGSLIALTVAQMMLINLKTFEARYYLFLVPLYGAGLGILMSLVLQKLNQKYRKAVVATTAFVIGLIAIGSFAEAWAAVHANDVEIEGAVTRAGGMLDEASVVVSRKPHLPFYWGLAAVDFPDVGSIDELRDNLEPLAEQSIVYLYYGSQEQRLKPQFYEILDPSNGMLPPWLTPVAEGDIGTQVWTTRHFVRILLGRKDGWSNRGKWILYRFHPTTGSGMSGEVPREALPRR